MNDWEIVSDYDSGINKNTIYRQEFVNGLRILAIQDVSSSICAYEIQVDLFSDIKKIKPGSMDLLYIYFMNYIKYRRINEQLYKIGANLSISINNYNLKLTCFTNLKQLLTAIKIVRSLLIDIEFIPALFEFVKEEYKRKIKFKENDAITLCKKSFFENVYLENNPLKYLYTYCNNISLSELQNFYYESFTPKNTIIAITGQLSPKQITEYFFNEFKNWRQSNLEHDQKGILNSYRLGHKQIIDLNISNIKNGHIIVGVPGFNYSNNLYLPGMVGNFILGQLGLLGRLGEFIRQQSGLVYKIKSEILPTKYPGPWWIVCDAKVEKKDIVLGMILETIMELRDKGPTQEELNLSINSILNSLPVRLSHPITRTMKLIELEYYGLGLNYLREYKDNLLSLTTSSIRNAYRTFFDDKNITIIHT
ncbi:M16 family metallopeptidase [Bacillus sp. JJ1562]|uniref:M16 family metallopeptidase n=1 Tax=Bacillus sp. JJ1562 TaxID=3122960 RepID=UPI00300288D5